MTPTTNPDPTNRRRFRYKLRTLLAMIVLLSLPLGWFGWKMREAERQRRAVEAIERAGGRVLYDYEFDGPDKFNPRAEPPTPAWLREPLVDVVSVFGYGGGGDESLEHVKGLAKLRLLEVSGPKVTDAGLENVKGLRRLRFLMVICTQVTDAGLENIRELTRLEQMDLSGSQITDVGLEHLKGLENLEHLQLLDTEVTSQGIEELQDALPNCEIHWDDPDDRP